MAFMIERLVPVYSVSHGDQIVWRKVCPSGTAKPFEWSTRREAEGFVGLIYDHAGQKNDVRVVEVSNVEAG